MWKYHCGIYRGGLSAGEEKVYLANAVWGAIEQTGLSGGFLWSPLAPADIKGEVLVKSSLMFLILLLLCGCHAHARFRWTEGVYKNVTRAKEIGGICRGVRKCWICWVRVCQLAKGLITSTKNPTMFPLDTFRCACEFRNSWRTVNPFFCSHSFK